MKMEMFCYLEEEPKEHKDFRRYGEWGDVDFSQAINVVKKYTEDDGYFVEWIFKNGVKLYTEY